MSMPHVVIVGGGIYGWSCALRLAELGATATVVDPRPVQNGDRASGGTTRVLRVEYGEAAVYSELTVRARQRWREIEATAGADLYTECGVLFLVPDHDEGAWESASLRICGELDVPGAVLDPADVPARWPAIRPDGIRWALFNPIGGILRARQATVTVARLACAAGARFVQTRAVEFDSRGVTLDDGSRVAADQVVLSTGAWTRRLVPGVSIRSTRQVITYLRGGPADIPVFSDGAPFAMYGMPAFDGDGLKIASHDPGDEVDPDDPFERMARQGELDHIADYARRRFVLDLVDTEIARTEVCFYALTPTEDPVVDRLADGSILCAGFSGHGFKFAPVLGAAVAELAIGRDPSVDLTPFRIPSASVD